MQLPTVNPDASPPNTSSGRGFNVVIVGLMGSGKTTVGRLAAQKLRFTFIDTDQIIIDRAGKPIPGIFAAEGEEGFRRRETEALRLLLGRQGYVIATGGGIVTRPENIPLLRQLGFVVWLAADPAVLHRRTMHSTDRPLLSRPNPEATLRTLSEARSSLYEAVADEQIQTDDLNAEDVAYGLAESAKLHFRHRGTP